MATIEEARAQSQQRHDAELIARAVAILEAKECDFKIITRSGDEFGNLVAERKPVRVMINDFVKETNYLEIIGKIKEFGSDIVPAPKEKWGDKKYIENLRSSVHNGCKRLWGEKTFKVKVAEELTHVEVLREGDKIDEQKA